MRHVWVVGLAALSLAWGSSGPVRAASGTTTITVTDSYSPPSLAKVILPPNFIKTDVGSAKEYASLQLDGLTCVYRSGGTPLDPGVSKKDVKSFYNFLFCTEATGTPRDLDAQNAARTNQKPGDAVYFRNQVIVRAYKGGSNILGAVSIDVTLYSDTDAPTIFSMLRDPILTNQAAFALPVTISDASSVSASVYQDNVLSQIFGSASFTYNTVLHEGTNTFKVTFQDEFGNEGQPLLLQHVVLDTVAPVISTTAQSPLRTNQATYELPVMIIDASPVVTRIYQNGVLVQSLSGSSVLGRVTLQEGDNTFRITAVDGAGNEGLPVDVLDVFLDSVPPAISIIARDHVLTNQVQFAIPVAISDADGAVTEIFQNGNLMQTFSGSSFIFNATLREGPNTFRITSQDEAGNEATPVLLGDIVLDTVLPLLATTVQDHQSTSQSVFLLPVTVVDTHAVSTKVYQNGLLVHTTGDLNFAYQAALTEGLNEFRITALDAAGNEANPILLEEITLDSSIPILSVIARDYFFTNQRVFSIPVTVTDASNVITRVYQNGLLMQTFEVKGFVFNAALQEGVNSFRITCEDSLGNQAVPVVLEQIVLDTVAPKISYSSPAPKALVNHAEVFFTGASDEALSGVLAASTSLVLAPGAREFSGPVVLPNGLNYVTLSGTDLAGNVGTLVAVVRVAPALSDNSIQNPPKGFVLTEDGFVFDYGPAFGGASSDICRQMEETIQDLNVGIIALQAGQELPGFPATPAPQILDPNNVESFLSPEDDPLHAFKLGYLVTCKGYIPLPSLDCETGRSYFMLLAGTSPEEMILDAIPGLNESLKNFLAPRFNVCTGMNFDDLNCEDLMAIMPLIANLGVPGLGALIDNPLGDLLVKEALCRDLDCDNPLVYTVPPTALYCLGIGLPEIPTPHLSVPDFNWSGPDFDWGGHCFFNCGDGSVNNDGSGIGTVLGLGVGSGPSYDNPNPTGDGSGVGGSSGACGYFAGGCGTISPTGDVTLDCALFPNLPFCGSVTNVVQIICSMLPQPAADLTFGELVDLSTSLGVRLQDLLTSVLACTNSSSGGAFPDLLAPVVTITNPVDGQNPVGTVLVTGSVDKSNVRVRVNGQPVVAADGASGVSFSVSIAVPADGKITVQAADAWGRVGERVVQLNVVMADPCLSIAFVDSKLEAAVRLALNKPTGPITKIDALGLKKLTANGKGITNLSGLECFKNLTDISMVTNAVTDLSPIAGAVSMVNLSFTQNKIQSIAPLAGMVKLITLEFTSNFVSDLTPVFGMKSLIVLNANSNQIQNSIPLRGLVSVRSVSIIGNQLTEIEGLRGISTLTDVNVGGNHISDLSPLSTASLLGSLQFGGNQVTNLNPLSGLKGLSILIGVSNQITEIEPLRGLTTLRTLHLTGNSVLDLSPLSASTGLRELGVGSNQLSSLNAISGLTLLQRLFFSSNQVSDLGPLIPMTGLRNIEALQNPFSCADPAILILRARGVVITSSCP